MTDVTQTRQRLANNIKRLRHERGLTAEQAAAQATVSQAYWWKLEAAVYWPSDGVLDRIARTLGVEAADLLGGGD